MVRVGVWARADVRVGARVRIRVRVRASVRSGITGKRSHVSS